jgi:hypothetical protein
MLTYLIPIIISSILAVAYRVNFLKLGKTIYGFAFLAIATFAGLSFENRLDWVYDQFFSNVNLADNPFQLYFDDNAVTPNFEIGFYFLNYAIKYVGGTNSLVLLLASVFCAYSVYSFTKNFAGNKFYILTIYFTHAYITLHFAQVRQSIAIGFFLLGCTHFLKYKKKLSSLMIAMIGPLFQISSIIYLFLLMIVFCGLRISKSLKGDIWGALIPSMMIFMIYFLDANSALTFLGDYPIFSRIVNYNNGEIEHSPALFLHLIYLSFIAYYIFKNLADVDPDRLFIKNIAIVFLVTSITMALAFPGIYAIYSRVYQVASVFQAFALSIIFVERKGWIHDFVFTGTIIVSIISYYRIVDAYSESLIPYRFIIN